MQFWNNFAAKHPAAAKWVREGGLFVIVSNLITVFKYLLLQFLPAAFRSLPVVDFGWPGIDVTLFGIVTLVILLQPMKAPSPISFTPAGIVTAPPAPL